MGATGGAGSGQNTATTPGSGLARAGGVTPAHGLKTPGRGPSNTPEDANLAAAAGNESPVGTPMSPAEMQEHASASLLPLARKRTSDAKFAVRRAALGLLESLLALSRAPPAKADSAVAATACGDALVTVRKQGLALCTNALRRHPSKDSARLWLHAALPLVNDVESSLQEKTLNVFEEMLIGALADPQLVMQLTGATGDKAAALAVRPSARALPLLAELPLVGSAAARNIGVALQLLQQRKRLKSSALARACQRVVDAAAEDGASSRFGAAVEGAWIVLHQLSAIDGGCVPWKFLEPAWTAAAATSPESAGAQRVHLLVAKTMAHAARNLKAGEAARVATAVHAPLVALSIDPSLVGPYVRVLDRIAISSETRTDDPSVRWLTSSHKWTYEVTEKCTTLLRTFCAPIVGGAAESGASAVAQGEVIAALGLLGEASLVHPPAVPRDASTLVQAIAVPPSGHDGACPAHVSTHAWTCLGKLCLTDERFAKSAAPLFAQCVSRSSGKAAAPPACRNNAALALCDLCITGTG